VIQNADFVRGYGIQAGERENWETKPVGIGASLSAISNPGRWKVSPVVVVLPYYENKIYLDHQNLDQWDYN
jgi:hypothetical protein